ncbi:MAG TPA: flagellar basal body L-ring protein FlgH [Pirellulales bacterium]|nr:flagellar basal body L-ring protein FlgH [Pirellulales bacterium]
MKFFKRTACATVAWLAFARGVDARAQSSSLYGSPGARRPLTLEATSWFYIKPEEPPEIQLNDVVTIIIDEKSQYINQTQFRRQQRTSMDAQLEKWLQFKNFGLGLAPMTGGAPEIEGLYNLQNQVQANLRQADGLQLRVGAEVVDLRPNGNLVLEAHRKVMWNNEIAEASMSGIIRRQDVLPNNTVLSEDVAELQLYVRQAGHIRDSWRRGWLWLFLDRHKPF